MNLDETGAAVPAANLKVGQDEPGKEGLGKKRLPVIYLRPKDGRE